VTSSKLPHWDVSAVYPSLDSPEFAEGFRTTTESITALARLFDEHHIAVSEPEGPVMPNVGVFETMLARLNEVLARVHTLGAYISAFVSTDSRDTLAQARQSELQQHTVLLAQLGTRFTAWVGTLDVETLVHHSAVAADHAFVLRRAHERSRHLMSPAEEALAAEMNVTGGSAWANFMAT